MPPNFFDPLAASFWDMLQLGIGAAVTTLTIKFSGWQSTKKKELAERRVKDAEIMARLDELANQSQAVKSEVKNSHGTNLRHDLDVAIKSATEARDNSTQALKIVKQISDSLESLTADFRESKREHIDFRERHNQSTEEIHDLNKRVNALFSAQNKKENNHE